MSRFFHRSYIFIKSNSLAVEMFHCGPSINMTSYNVYPLRTALFLSCMFFVGPVGPLSSFVSCLSSPCAPVSVASVSFVLKYSLHFFLS